MQPIYSPSDGQSDVVQQDRGDHITSKRYIQCLKFVRWSERRCGGGEVVRLHRPDCVAVATQSYDYYSFSVSPCNGTERLRFDIVSTRYRPLWDVTIAGSPRCPVWCRLVTVPTDLFTTFTRPTGPFLSEWAKCQPGNTQNRGTVLPIANLMAHSESGSPASWSPLIVTTGLWSLLWEIFASDRQTDSQRIKYWWCTVSVGTHKGAAYTMHFKLNRMHEVLTILTDVHGVSLSVCLSRGLSRLHCAEMAGQIKSN